VHAGLAAEILGRRRRRTVRDVCLPRRCRGRLARTARAATLCAAWPGGAWTDQSAVD